MRAGIAQGGIISPVPFSLYVNDVTSPSCHEKLAFYADFTAVIATYRQPALLVKYLETFQWPRAVSEWMEDRHERLEELRDALRQDP